MKTFIYAGRIYIRCIPGKRLFNSTLVHEVVNRGDIFALDAETQLLTIIPGTAQVDHTEHALLTSTVEAQTAAIKKLRAISALLELGESFSDAKAAVQQELPL